MALRRSRDIERELEIVLAFRKVLDEYASLHDEVIDVPMGVTGLQPKEGREDDLRRVRRKLGELSGDAARVTAGKSVIVAPGVSGNLIANWRKAFTFESAMVGLGLQALEDFTDSAIGDLRGQFAEAQSRERGVIGVLASFLRVPTAVRDAAGLRPGTASGRTAIGVIVCIQTVVTGVAISVITRAVFRLLERIL